MSKYKATFCFKSKDGELKIYVEANSTREAYKKLEEEKKRMEIKDKLRFDSYTRNPAEEEDCEIGEELF